MATEWSLESELRQLLVCPQCRNELVDSVRGLLCIQDGLVYPVVEGVPFMLPECAHKASTEEIEAARSAL